MRFRFCLLLALYRLTKLSNVFKSSNAFFAFSERVESGFLEITTGSLPHFVGAIWVPFAITFLIASSTACDAFVNGPYVGKYAFRDTVLG